MLITAPAVCPTLQASCATLGQFLYSTQGRLVHWKTIVLVEPYCSVVADERTKDAFPGTKVKVGYFGITCRVQFILWDLLSLIHKILGCGIPVLLGGGRAGRGVSTNGETTKRHLWCQVCLNNDTMTQGTRQQSGEKIFLLRQSQRHRYIGYSGTPKQRQHPENPLGSC